MTIQQTYNRLEAAFVWANAVIHATRVAAELTLFVAAEKGDLRFCRVKGIRQLCWRPMSEEDAVPISECPVKVRLAVAPSIAEMIVLAKETANAEQTKLMVILTKLETSIRQHDARMDYYPTQKEDA